MPYEIKPGDIAIILHPVVEEGEWTGAIKSGLVFGAAGSEEGMRAALDEAVTMASAQRFLEIYPDAWEDFTDLRHEILQEMFPEQYAQAEAEEEEERGYAVDDNVVTLNRWTKTEGSA